MHWLLKSSLLCQFGGRVVSHSSGKLTRLKGQLTQLVLLGLARLVLDVGNSNHLAIALYERKGFKPTGVTGHLPPPPTRFSAC